MVKSITSLVLILLFLTSCSEHREQKEELPLIKVDSHVLIHDSAALQSETDFIEFSLECEEGKSYRIDFYQNSEEYYIYPKLTVTSPDGSVDSSYSFNCAESGTYQFKVSPPLQYGTWPFFFFYKISEYSSSEEMLEGRWFFQKRITRAFDRSQVYTAGADNAMRLLEFRNDSAINTYYDIYGDSLYSLKGPFAGSEYADYSYRIDSNTLLFRDSNTLGSITDIYTRCDSDAEDFIWHGENISVPEELLGMWYYKSNQFKFRYNHVGETIDSSSSLFYSTGDESSYILSIMKDSIVGYSRGFGYVDSFTYTIKGSYFFLMELERSGDTFHHDQVNFWQDGSDYSLGYNCSSYSLYKGEDPTKSWKTTHPEVSTNLGLGEPFKRDVNGGDTIWIKLSFEKGKRYQIKPENPADALNYSTFMVNTATMEPEYFTEFYSANSTGTYYLVLFVYLSEDHSEIPPVSLTVSEYSFYD